MSRTLVIGDLHGGLKALQQLWERADIGPNDRLVFLGDYADGWSQTPELFDFLIEKKSHQPMVLLMGNHDALLAEWLEQGAPIEPVNLQWFRHGGASTVKAYQGIGQRTRDKHLHFIRTLGLHFTDHRNRLFLHAGFTNLNGIAFEYFDKSFYWDRTLWELALATDPNMPTTHVAYPKRLTLYPEVFIGHTPVTRIGCTTPQQRACVWNLDTGAAFQGLLTAMDVDTKQFWQSDPLPQLYPNEKGRTI